MAKGGVYQIRNLRSGLIYIGGTRDFAARWRAHRAQLKSGKHPAKRLLVDFWEHGLSGFVFEVLEEVADAAELLAAEQRHLDRLRPFDPLIGYNTHPLAEGPETVRRRPETGERISAALKGRALTDERKARISVARIASARAKAAVTAHNATKRALVYADAEEIRRLHADGVNAAELARRYGVTRNPIRQILAGKTYTNP